MKAQNNLSSLGVSLEELYAGIDKQIIIKLTDKNFEFHVVLIGRDSRPDCKLSSWGANLWMRTRKGTNCEKYKSFAALQRALINQIKHRVESQGEIIFQISDEVHTM